MRNKFIIAAITAAGILGTSAIAQTAAGGGVTASGKKGSVAGGAGMAQAQPQDAKRDKRDKRREDRAERREQTGNAASTHGSGTVYTDRNTATGGVTAGGNASGSGAQSTSTAIDAYGSTTRDGSEAEVFGDSTADSQPK